MGVPPPFKVFMMGVSSKLTMGGRAARNTVKIVIFGVEEDLNCTQLNTPYTENLVFGQLD